MSNGVLPAVGNWYQTHDKQDFEVVAVDEAEGLIGIQYFGGELDEMEFEAWLLMGFTEIAPPEDWSGPFDDLEKDDLGYTDTNIRPEARNFSIEDFEHEK